MSDPQTGRTQRNPRRPSENGRQRRGPKSLSEKLLSPTGGKTSAAREWTLGCRATPPIGGAGGHWKMAEPAAHRWGPRPAGWTGRPAGSSSNGHSPRCDQSTALLGAHPREGRSGVPEPARGRPWQLCLKEPRSATGPRKTRELTRWGSDDSAARRNELPPRLAHTDAGCRACRAATRQDGRPDSEHPSRGALDSRGGGQLPSSE